MTQSMRGGAYTVFPISSTCLTVCNSRRSQASIQAKIGHLSPTPAGDGGSRPVSRCHSTPGDRCSENAVDDSGQLAPRTAAFVPGGYTPP